MTCSLCMVVCAWDCCGVLSVAGLVVVVWASNKRCDDVTSWLLVSRERVRFAFKPRPHSAPSQPRSPPQQARPPPHRQPLP